MPADEHPQAEAYKKAHPERWSLLEEILLPHIIGTFQRDFDLSRAPNLYPYSFAVAASMDILIFSGEDGTYSITVEDIMNSDASYDLLAVYIVEEVAKMYNNETEELNDDDDLNEDELGELYQIADWFITKAVKALTPPES